jgi:ppGpp synthetase/RelA/SpoT-type nucleotidyltranferase
MIGKARMPSPTLEDYPAWAKESFGFDPLDEQFRSRYEYNVRIFLTTVEQSEQWNAVVEGLSQAGDEYAIRHGVGLFFGPFQRPSLKLKSVESLIEKTWRINVLENPNFPDPPKITDLAGDRIEWVKEANLYTTIKDLVRCRVVCRYMDGPEFICSSVTEKNANGEGGIDLNFKSMETDLGYYSWHLRCSWIPRFSSRMDLWQRKNHSLSYSLPPNFKI